MLKNSIIVILVMFLTLAPAQAYTEYGTGDIIERNINLPSYYIANYGGSLSSPIRYTYIDHSPENAGNTLIESVINISNIPYVDLEFVVTHYEYVGSSYQAISEDYWTKTVRCSYTIHDYDFPDAGEYGKKVIYHSPYLESTNYKLIDTYFTSLYESGWRPEDMKHNEFSDHPDVFKIDFSIESEDSDMETTGTAYLDVSGGVIDRHGSTDYGYGTGRGSGGGSGSIYEGLGLSGIGEGTGDMSELFASFFWILIPLVFMLCIFQMVLKAL